jgi:flagellar basal-body rod protein FlgB
MTDTSLFDLAQTKLAWLDKRQSLLAQNIANADTPGYQARDIAPFADSLAQAQDALAPTRTSPLHLAGTEDDAGFALDRPPARAIDGNSVQLDVELTKVADTNASQELVSDLYSKYLSLYQTALGH